LRKEREALALPFSRSPFIYGEKAAIESTDDIAVGELRAKVPNELPWSDLLLEIAMTTAFASLTDGTPILLSSNALSYLCYFFLVWWIWASQTAYNLRYRQADWLHRIWVFLQLLVFSSLAAFTRNFDITNGISVDKDKAATDQLLLDFQDSPSDLSATKFRDTRLPRLNARGLSAAMALSRMLLLLQYVIVLHHARYIRRGPIWTHIISVTFSAACYVAAFIALQKKRDVSEKVAIVKIGLWYFPVLVEVIAHFVANTLTGHVRYSTKGIIDRSGTLFIIILGGGLDKITTGFQDIVGNTGLGRHGSGLFLSAAVIFLVTYLLYFGSTGSSKKVGNQRAMTWFFAHILYLSAVIITLQGVATSLSFSNLDRAIEVQLQSTFSVRKFLTDHPGVNLTVQNMPDAQQTLQKIGLSVDSYVEVLNGGIYQAYQAPSDTNPVIANNTFLQLEVYLIDYLLRV
jgi:low temperature requirement protein LtrA